MSKTFQALNHDLRLLLFLYSISDFLQSTASAVHSCQAQPSFSMTSLSGGRSLSPPPSTNISCIFTQSLSYFLKPCPCQTTHTHTRLTAFCLGLPGSAGTRKVKPIWILLKQETVSGSGISWAMCKSVPHSRQITMPASHHCFLQARCPSCCPTNSVKALKATGTLPMPGKETTFLIDDTQL